MAFRWILFLWSFILDLAAVSRSAEDDKDLEIMLRRQQLRIVERKRPSGPAIPRWQKVPLAALAMGLKGKSQSAHQNWPEYHPLQTRNDNRLASRLSETEMDLQTA